MKEICKNNIFTIIMTVLILSGFTGYVFGKTGEFSESENRYLASRPALSLSALSDGSFMQQFELYTEEQLPLRDELIKLKAVTGGLMLKDENNGIACGRNGYLFEKLVCTNEQLSKNKAAVINFAKQADRDINVCIIPNSCEILKDLTPEGFPNVSQKEYIDEFYKELSGYDKVSTTDMFDMLSEHKSEYIYYRTDHHWTTQGAYYGYLKLCADMGLEAVGIEELAPLRIDIPGFFGTYYSKYRGMGVDADTLTYFDIPVASFEAGGKAYDTMYDEDKLDTYDKYAMFMHGNEGLSVAVPADDGRARRQELVLFKDSYSNCLVPFLTYNYDRITIVDLRYYPGSVKELLAGHPDSDVLIMYNFMHFNEDNHFYRLTS